MNSFRWVVFSRVKWGKCTFSKSRTGRFARVRLSLTDGSPRIINAKWFTSQNGSSKRSLHLCCRRPWCDEINLLSGRNVQRTFQRGFRVKGDKSELKPEKLRNEHVAKTEPVRGSGKSRAAPEDGTSILSFVLKTGAYTIGFSALVFAGSALWQQENMRRRHEEFWNQGLTRREQRKRGEARSNLNGIWNHLSMTHKVTYGIMGLNLLVYACWKFGSPRIMQAWFTLGQFPLQSSISGISRHLGNMFLSMFSHKGIIHLYVNMYVLSSFAAAWSHMSHSTVGDPNLNGAERYLAFYLTAGMTSSFLSSFIKVLGRIPQPSLGASGAILGLIGYTCEKMPNNLLSIAFIPGWTFSAGSAKNFILAFDTVGLVVGAVTGWRYILFDHAGHLGGMLFGIWYAKYGEKLLNRYCKYIAEISDKK